MIRHVVVFTWVDTITDGQRQAIAEALATWAEQARTYGTVSFGPDLAIAAGNADFAVIADFPDEDAYHGYAADPRHVALVTDVLRPHLAARAAVQYSR